MTDKTSQSDKATLKPAREPGIPEFLLAMKVVTPLVRRQMENKSFDARVYLDRAIASAHKIAGASLSGAPVNRYLIGNLTSMVIKSGLIDAEGQDMMEKVVAGVFSGEEQTIARLVAELSDAEESQVIGDLDERVWVLRAALLSNCAEILADVNQFSFWLKKKDEVARSVVNLVGDLAVKFAEEELRTLTPRLRSMLLQSLVGRAASIVGQSYRTVAYAAVDRSRKEVDTVKKLQVRKIAGNTYFQEIAELSDNKMKESVEMAMSFCNASIAPQPNNVGSK